MGMFFVGKRRSSEPDNVTKQHPHEVLYGHNHRKSIPHEEQYYSGLPCPPACTPGRHTCFIQKFYSTDLIKKDETKV